MRTAMVVSLALLFCVALVGWAEAPPLIAYQGALTDAAGKPANGTFSVTLSMYEGPTGGSPVWSETLAGVPVAKGVFSLILGASSPLPMGLANCNFLEVSVGGKPMLPRQRLLSVPYALEAQNAQTLGGEPPSAFHDASNLTAGTIPEERLPEGLAGDAPQIVNTGDIANGAVTTPKIADRAVTGAKIALGASVIGRVTGRIPNFAFGAQNTNPDEGSGLWGKAAAKDGSAGVVGISTATSGVGVGVSGETRSTGNDSAGVYGLATAAGGAAGVLGEHRSALGTGAGVEGVTFSAEQSAGVSGLATAPAGPTYGVEGIALSSDGRAAGVYGSATATSGAVTGVKGQTRSTGAGTRGVYGLAAAASGATIGVWGETRSSSGGAMGVYGLARAGTGNTKGVLGETLSTGSSAVGVHGVASASTGATTGVLGETRSSDANAAGIRGLATAAGGQAAGIFGQTLSDSTNSAGLRGLASSAHSKGAGVLGQTTSGEDGAAGVRGVASATGGVTSGVFGKSASRETGAAGVHGVATATTGQVYGVYGESASSNPHAAGVMGVDKDLTYSSGVGVRGEINVGRAGVLGYANTEGNGVWGETLDKRPISAGVYGRTSPPDSWAPGVWGDSMSPWAPGVLGESHATTEAGIGVQGLAASTEGIGVKGQAAAATGPTTGVLGKVLSDSGTGVEGQSVSTQGASIGVRGTAASPGGYGVVGENAALSGTAVGVLASTASGAGHALHVVTTYGTAYGIFVERGKGYFAGDVQFAGGHGPHADVAENYHARGVEAGDVVVIGEDGKLVRCAAESDPRVAGIISTSPTVHVGRMEAGPDAAPLALVGIVPCKVDATQAPIQPGDLLVSSSTPGHAMKCTSKRPAAGTVIGKALEPLASGTGTIQVLVTLR